MRKRDANETENTAHNEEYTREVEMRSKRLRQLAEIFRPILFAMKLTGQYFGETALGDCSGRRTMYVSRFFSALVVVGQWLMVVIGVTSHLYIGFSSMSSFSFLLVNTAWYVQNASSTTVCLFVLPLMNERRSRFAQFLSSFATKAPELDGMRKKAVKGLAVACLAAVINSIVIILLSVRFNGVISIFPPWNQTQGMYVTVRVTEIAFGVLDSFAWTLPPLIFCVTCMLLEKMFATLQNKISNESIYPFTIAYLRQEHLKLCEIVELANAVFSLLLFVIISLDIPLMCVNFYQLIKRSNEADTIVVLCYVYWSFCISTLLVVIFIFGNRVNNKREAIKNFRNGLSKLQKLDNIESRLDNLFKAVFKIEDAVANLDKEVHNLKEKMKNTNKTVKELEESVDFNDEEIANLKRDVKAAQKKADDLGKELLYQEHYSRRENLMFIGIEEHNTTEQDEQGTRHEVENTKEIIYKFMEDELQISNPRDKIEFQRIHRVGKPKDDGPRPVIARFLRYSDRELVLRQARKTLKDKDFNVFEDIPKELYELRKSQNKKFKDAKARGCSVYFSKRFPDKLYVNGKFIPSNAPL
ncbi:hypothetical protein ACROYT_G022796 [Oculina patagonica]